MKKTFTNCFSVLFLLIFMVVINFANVQAQGDEITFGYVEWPGVTVKTHVVMKIAEYLGYETEALSGMTQVVYKGMETGDIDVFLGNWMPTMKVNFDKYKEKGAIETVRINLDDVVYKTAVPKYVWDAGVKSFEDLKDHGDKFDHKIYGIEPGNDGNIIILNAIEDNKYQLEDWELVTSSTAGMLGAVNSAYRRKDWIAFNGWKPHYMNVLYDIKYLEDPEGIWPTGERVLTVTRTGFGEERPNFYKILEQFEVTAPIQDYWILEYQEKGRDPEDVAEEWIANNLDIVYEWVDGVKSFDGETASEVIKQSVEK